MVKYNFYLLSFLLILCGCEKNISNPQRELSSLSIGKGNFERVFYVETSLSDKEKSMGLMYRKELPDNQGMIFIFNPTQIISMWMKNTYISLDMIFVNNENKISGIVEKTVPFSENLINSPKNTKAVIELPAGTVGKKNIRIGEKVFHWSLENL